MGKLPLLRGVGNRPTMGRLGFVVLGQRRTAGWRSYGSSGRFIGVVVAVLVVRCAGGDVAPARGAVFSCIAAQYTVRLRGRAAYPALARRPAALIPCFDIWRRQNPEY